MNDEPNHSTDDPRGADPLGGVADNRPPSAAPDRADPASAAPDRAAPGSAAPEFKPPVAAPGDELALEHLEAVEAEAESDTPAETVSEAEADVPEANSQVENSPAASSPAASSPAASSPAASSPAASSPAASSPAEAAAEPRPPRKLEWFILKVQSNREDSIRESLLRRIAIAGLDDAFDQIIVPIEKVSEFKNGKKRTVKRKLYPGYLVVHMEYNDDTWYLVRETPGIGDFTGSGGKPTPMAPHEVSKIISIIEPEKPDETPRIDIPYKKGDRVKITEGTFENFEGDVDHIDEANGRVTVMINIFGRSTPVELEYWQIEKL